MRTRTILYADEGKILTDGETYGTMIYLADGSDESRYYMITEEQYNMIVKEKEEREKLYGGIF